MTATGDVVEVSEESDRELWLAARVGLGALGVISEITLRCVPLFTIHRVDERNEMASGVAISNANSSASIASPKRAMAGDA